MAKLSDPSCFFAEVEEHELGFCASPVFSSFLRHLAHFQTERWGGRRQTFFSFVWGVVRLQAPGAHTACVASVVASPLTSWMLGSCGASFARQVEIIIVLPCQRHCFLLRWSSWERRLQDVRIDHFLHPVRVAHSSLRLVHSDYGTASAQVRRRHRRGLVMPQDQFRGLSARRSLQQGRSAMARHAVVQAVCCPPPSYNEESFEGDLATSSSSSSTDDLAQLATRASDGCLRLARPRCSA